MLVRSCDAMLEGHRGAVWCVAACGSGAASGGADRTVRLWALPIVGGGGGATVRAAGQVLRGHRGAVRAVAATGWRVVSAAADGTLRVWAAESGACLGSVAVFDGGGGPGRRAVARSLAVWGGLVVGGCDDGVVRAWDLRTLEPAAGGPGGAPTGGPVRAVDRW